MDVERDQSANNTYRTTEHRNFSHLGGFDFVASAARPASQVRQDLTLLSVHTWLHVAPPFLGYNRSWSIKWRIRGKEIEQVY